MVNDARERGLSDHELVDVDFRRKKIHNAIEDIKGAIRVFVRVRPISEREINLGDHQAVHGVDMVTVEVENSGKFSFDAVWTPGTQETVFEDTRDLIQSAVDGYNVTIFAYGQTGAGKTYTMTGKPTDPGVIPRMADEVFLIRDRDNDRYEFTVSVTMIELYCAAFADLL